MRVLYANGCSWTEGAEIPNTMPLAYCTSTKYYGSWPFLLSQELNIPLCINEGAGAGSNDRIYRKTYEYIIKYLASGKDPKELLVVIGWTTPERTEISCEGTFFRVNTNGVQGEINFQDKPLVDNLNEYRKLYYKLYDDKPNKLRTVQMMIGLRMFCKAHNIEYYDFVAIGSQPIEYMNISKNIYGMTLDRMYIMSWDEYCETNIMTRYEHKHPTIKTHKNWAELLSTHIKL